MGRIDKVKLWGRILFSILIVLHISCLVILPNPSSILSRYFPSALVSYASTLGLSYTWQFFAPNPGGETFVLYEIKKSKGPYAERESDSDEFKTYYWPPRKREVSWESYNRQVYHSLITSLDSERAKVVLVPFLCSRHKGATSVYLESVRFVVPSMERVRIDRRKRDDYLKKVTLPGQEYECEGNA